MRLATRPPCRATKPPRAAWDPAGTGPVGSRPPNPELPAPAGVTAGRDEPGTVPAVEAPDAPLTGVARSGPAAGAAETAGAAGTVPGAAGADTAEPAPDAARTGPDVAPVAARDAVTAGAALRRITGDWAGSARRIAKVRRKAVIGPGADSGELGTALPPERTGGGAGLADGASESAAGDRRAAPARATDRRSAAATPAPLCWGAAPALAACAGVESPPPEEFPGGPPEGEPAEVDGLAAPGGAGRGARNLRCSCELLIGPAAATSSIRRTGIAVETRPPAIVPGERGWSSVGTCRAARARPRGGRLTRAAEPAAADPAAADPAAAEPAAADPGADGVPGSSTGSAWRGVHQRGGRTSAWPSERAGTAAAAASARRTATGRAVAAANRVEDSAIRPRLAARARAAGRPGRRSRCAAERPSAVGSRSPSDDCPVLIGSSIGNRGERLRVAPATPRCWTS